MVRERWRPLVHAGSRWARSLWAVPVACCALAVQAAAPADTQGSGNPSCELVGTYVTVELRSGKILRDAKLIEARPGKFAGTVTSLTLAEEATGAHAVFGAAAVQRVTSSDGAPRLVYDAIAKILIPPGASNLEEIRKAAREEPATAADRRLASARPSRAELEEQQRRRKQDEEQQRRKEKEAERLAFRKKTGVWLWPELTEEQQRAALEEEKQFVKQVGEAFRANTLRLTETEYFLLCSDMPPQQVAMCTPYLDKMYQELCTAFAIARGTNIWYGKAVVVVFLRKEDFQEFERKFFDKDASKYSGFMNSGKNGRVVISCHRSDDPLSFAHVLVHETTHGFMYRYKSGQSVPSWLNEGAAEWIADAVVPASKGRQQKQREAILLLRQSGSLGGDFFTAKPIQLSQYGAAEGITDFLLRTDRKRYRELIDGIKTGLPWEESLQQAYGFTPEQLAQKYGLAIGVPGLRP